MKIKGVVFDLDHTLYDRYGTINAIIGDFCRHFSARLAPNMDEHRVGELLCRGDKKYIYHGWRRILQFLCDEGVFADPPEYAEYKECLLSLFGKAAVPYPFAKPLLAELRKLGYKIGLITNGRKEIQRAKITMLGIESYFDEIIVCGEFGIQKPDAAPFLEMARRLGEEPNNLVYVGDNPINDVDASRNAGLIPIEVLTADCPMEGYEPADYRIQSVETLLPMLEILREI